MKSIIESEFVSVGILEPRQGGEISFPENLLEVRFTMDNLYNFQETEKVCYILGSEFMLKTGGWK